VLLMMSSHGNGMFTRPQQVVDPHGTVFIHGLAKLAVDG
jgi:hypothetical protein